MRLFNHMLAGVVWLAVCVALALKSDPMLTGIVFFAPFTLGPHAVSHWLCFVLRSNRSAVLLGIGMLAYVVFFFVVYIDVFYVHMDPQSSIALMFVGFVSLPVMIPVWLGAFALERGVKERAKLKGEAAAGGNDPDCVKESASGDQAHSSR